MTSIGTFNHIDLVDHNLYWDAKFKLPAAVWLIRERLQILKRQKDLG